MKSPTILFLLVTLLLLNFNGCTTMDDKPLKSESKLDAITLELERLSKEGEIYCVAGDIVLIFNNTSGKLIPRDFDVTVEYYRFFCANPTEMEKLIYYKDLIGPSKGRLTASFFCPTLDFDYNVFYIFDESNQSKSLYLFWNRSYYDIPEKKSWQRETEWRLKYWDEISDWENNPMRNMNPTISYIDLNKNTCKMSSGYVGKIERFPNINYAFGEVLTTTIYQADTTRELGFVKEIFKPVMEIPIVDLSSHKKFDYICVNYEGLKVLAQDLQLRIVPKYPAMLILEK